MKNIFEKIGERTTQLIEEMGRIIIFLFNTVVWLFRPPFKLTNTLKQMEVIGINSVSVVVLTGFFTGAVFSLQTYRGFHQFGAEYLVGYVVALALTRELGPVLTALMVTGRAGSLIAAEIGSMKVTEQIDAMEVMAVNPVQYLIVPRIVAGMIVVPLLTIIADFVGIIGGYVIVVKFLGQSSVLFWTGIRENLHVSDCMQGLEKAIVFGLILSLIGCYKGYFAEGGAEGVGKATTRAVVIASVLILIIDYFMTATFFR
ncbi:MAG: ABC transporter permease [Candidatus Schekmanbacteria bacterium RIFCSPHIGHO2_02_FULL_38_11]|uniref:ABC transporter permease n=1 Tax=Candidatus Schekmanbacteria bacterium RIFCSPLOWO2_12_FULL_38_15 TaxID=1817883 RepID=A0A1F7SGU7_9BACT|nr:MAG: ABC transporter permease [Candidatus Schekmanbacteria bacterium GWA2_38_9]OGL49657.1 MAG: ABC transporter permease [Candidatus Schekmanbacteria bacterium RIFCSPLOWO2_02_FULL_38_14]OGL50379.1 MAG: ABC transporter permease [Candidatus Schekmanbacteria bacterium RIFCSPHIGHO2_02_FULL_38_11]OGL53010.1 MAG: ABC transporter permease [Candidatus Schekmanbacteria bacterium RIFCSPLOWO2_12_FULL_38_15]